MIGKNESLGSDNHGTIHPCFIETLQELNKGTAPSYGTDSHSQELTKVSKDLFGGEPFLVFNGTGANVVCLKSALKPYQSALCTEVAHMHLDECGAPENIAGIKLLTVPHQNGKLKIDDIKPLLIRRGDQHFSQPKLVSITQPTELGTVYSLNELKEIRQFCNDENLLLHVDGARFANACFTLKKSIKELVDWISPDLLSFGGTKNGFLFGELVIVRKESLKEDMKFYRKLCLQLPSKARYLSACFLKYLTTDLAHEIAQASCEKALWLQSEIDKLSHEDLKILYPVDSNALFIEMPSSWIKTLRDSNFFYVWEKTHDGKKAIIRLMPSFSTEQEALSQFLSTLSDQTREGGIS